MFGGQGGGMFGGGMMGQRPFDLRIVGMILVIALSAGFALVGDQGVFAQEPSNWFQAILSLVTIICYNLLADRALAFGMAAFFYLAILGGGGMIVFRIMEIHVIEPMMIKKKLEMIKREKAILNKLDDGTI